MMTEELEIRLLKFADGELTAEEEACVLLDCEDCPQQWKQLALALVTERRLTEALADFHGMQPSENSLTENSPTENSLLAAPCKPVRSTDGTTAKPGWPRATRLAAMSLALVLAFFVGRQQAQRSEPVVVQGKPTRPLPADEQLLSDGQHNDGQHNYGQHNNGQHNNGQLTGGQLTDERHVGREPMESPEQVAFGLSEPAAATYDERPVINPWMVVSKPVITQEERNAFSDAGLDVQEENTIYIVNDADGERWAIPWKTVNVRYSPKESLRPQ